MVPLLLVDDDAGLRMSLAAELGRHGGYVVSCADSIEAARRIVSQWSTPGVGVIDFMLPDGSGLELIKELSQRYSGMRLVLVSGYCSVSVAVEAMRHGAYDCIQKPFSVAALLNRLAPRRGGALPVESPSLARVEWEHIQRVLMDVDGNVSVAAERLGVERRSLQRKLRKRPPAR